MSCKKYEEGEGTEEKGKKTLFSFRFFFSLSSLFPSPYLGSYAIRNVASGCVSVRERKEGLTAVFLPVSVESAP